VLSFNGARAAAATSRFSTCRGKDGRRFNIKADSRNAPSYIPAARAAVNASATQRPQAGPGDPHFQQISSSSVKIRVSVQHASHATPNFLSSTLRAQITQACGYASVNKASANILYVPFVAKQNGLPESEEAANYFNR
jgi:hypothetical protein